MGGLDDRGRQLPGNQPALAQRSVPEAIRDAYGAVVTSFQVPWCAGIYIVAQLSLGMHLYHGVWSTLRSLGLADLPKVSRLDRWARGFAGLVTLGFLAPVIAVQAGLLTL